VLTKTEHEKNVRTKNEVETKDEPGATKTTKKVPTNLD
jgi:hypothetical protein